MNVLLAGIAATTRELPEPETAIASSLYPPTTSGPARSGRSTTRPESAMAC